jgi:hypothetical protein
LLLGTALRLAAMIDPTHDEIDFLRRLYESGGELALGGNMGLFKIDRLSPDCVTQQSASMDTVHFTVTEKGRDLMERALKAG